MTSLIGAGLKNFEYVYVLFIYRNLYFITPRDFKPNLSVLPTVKLVLLPFYLDLSVLLFHWYVFLLECMVSRYLQSNCSVQVQSVNFEFKQKS